MKKVQPFFESQHSDMNTFASKPNVTAMKKTVLSLMLCLVLPFTLAAQKKSIQSFLSYIQPTALTIRLANP